MPYPGYLQELSQLESQERLLQTSNADSALIGNNPQGSEIPCPVDFTPTTPSVLIQPSEAVEPDTKTEVHEADDEAKRTSPLVTEELDTRDKDTASLLLTPATVPTPTEKLTLAMTLTSSIP